MNLLDFYLSVESKGILKKKSEVRYAKWSQLETKYTCKSKICNDWFCTPFFYWYVSAYSLQLFAHVLGRGAVFAQNRVWGELLVLRQVKKHEKQSWCIIDYSD